jgi:hypothetical protein
MKTKSKEIASVSQEQTIRVVSTRDPIYDPYQRKWIEPMKAVTVIRNQFISRHLSSNSLKVV